MGGSYSSTSKAGKFASTPKRQRACSCYEGTSPATAPSIRRNASNINRNAKEFSKFWQNGGNFQPHQSVRRRGSTMQRSQSARRPRSMSIDPTVRSPPRVVPSGNSAAAAAAAAAANAQTPPPSAYNTPRESYRNETLERRGPGLNRVHSMKYDTYSPPARCNGMQGVPTTPTTLYHRHPNYNYHQHRSSLTASNDPAMGNFRTPVNLPRIPVSPIYDRDYLGNNESHLRQTSIY